MLSEERIRELLQPFGVELASRQAAQLQTYLELLLRWSRKISLTSIRDPEQCVTRHFGETLFIQTHDQLSGSLLDIGSGAGFPGLALKLVFPDLPATLLEPVAKKRAFLKEVIRCCEIRAVEVRPERLAEVSRQNLKFNSATARAVGPIERLVIECSSVLAEGGKFHLWTTRSQAEKLDAGSYAIAWTRHLAIPLSRECEILTGVLKTNPGRAGRAGRAGSAAILAASLREGIF